MSNDTRRDLVSPKALRQIQVRALRSDHLNLILFPTEQCNFRCTYCYERFDKGRMSSEVQSAIEHLICRRHDLRSLNISWFGGEPLVARDIVLALNEYAQCFCDRNGICFTSDITTNGFLLDGSLCHSLLNSGISRFQISLDGDAESHNSTRRLANGAPTFSRIVKNISELSSRMRSGEIILRIHYHLENIESIFGLIDTLDDLIKDKEHVYLYFKNVSPLGGSNDASFQFVKSSDRAGVVDHLTSYNRDRFKLFSLEGDYVCYACQANSLAIRSDGRIAKCTVALYDAANTIGRLLPDGTLEIDQNRHSLWLAPLTTGVRSDIACPVKSVKEANGRNQGSCSNE